MSPAKTDEPIEIPFGLWTRVGPMNHVLDSGADPPFEWAVLSRVTTLPGKSWNLLRPFFRPGKSWKTAKVMESHGKLG